MIHLHSVMTVAVLCGFAFILKDWGEIELDWQSKKFKMKRRISSDNDRALPPQE